MQEVQNRIDEDLWEEEYELFEEDDSDDLMDEEGCEKNSLIFYLPTLFINLNCKWLIYICYNNKNKNKVGTKIIKLANF